MKNADKELTFTYKGEEFYYPDAHIFLTKEKYLSKDGVTEKSSLKVRIPTRGAKAPPVGARLTLNGENFAVLLVRENFKGKNAHIYLELRS